MRVHLKHLEPKRDTVLKQLRAVAPELMLELDAWNAAIEKLKSSEEVQASGDSPYSKYRHAIDAIEDFLHEVGKPVIPSEIAKRVLDRGWLKGNRRRQHNVYDSLRYNVRYSGRLKLFGVEATPEFLKAWRVKKDAYPIGLGDWADEK